LIVFPLFVESLQNGVNEKLSFFVCQHCQILETELGDFFSEFFIILRNEDFLDGVRKVSNELKPEVNLLAAGQ
jgi:hypothetical protein